jgi:hypothetical protein
MPEDSDGPEPMGWWDTLVDDMAARAAEYEADGWTTVQLHTADVTARAGQSDERVGLSVLVPDDEFETVESVLGSGTVASYSVYRTTVEGYVAFLLSVETDDRTAILCPGYYALSDESVHAMFDKATEAGQLTVSLRRLDETAIRLSLDSPDLLAPTHSDE